MTGGRSHRREHWQVAPSGAAPAVSAACYALFHGLARCCADTPAGATPAGRSQPAWTQTCSALEHGYAKKRYSLNALIVYKFVQSNAWKGLEMAGRRACRHDVKRPRRGSNRMPKYRLSRDKQTYRCEDCKYRCAPDGNRHRYSSEVIDRARAEGASAAATGGAMEINEASALVWVKKPFRPSG